MGNRTVPALIDQQPSQLPRELPNRDDINPYISTYNVRYINPYLSGNYIIEALPTLGPWGIPYVMQGLAVQTCEEMFISTPEPNMRGIITHRADALSNAGQTPIGTAPTTGIYTGVEDHC